MGALGGLFNFDDGPVQESWLRALGASLARRGPDGEVIATTLSLGMVYRHYGTGSIEKSQSSLWQSRRGALLTFDGRLDNRGELAALLGLSNAEASTDSAVLLEGFARFGSSFVGKIVGDFALAYWDPTSRELTLGRDAAGVRTLYYYATPHSFAFASDIGSLVNAANVDTELDDEYVAAYLGCGVDEHHTIYRRVRSVRPAHALCVSHVGVISERRVWCLPFEPKEITYRNDRDYEAHFLNCFEDAVKVRLRTSHPVVAELSGGLDSSSVVCVADHLLRTGSAEAPDLSTISIVSSRSSTLDHPRFQAAVENRCGRPCVHVTERDVARFAPPAEPRERHVLSTLLIRSGWETTVCQHMRDKAACVLLTGTGGDEMFYPANNPLPALGDLWLQWRFNTLGRELRMWSAALREPYVRLLWQSFDVGLLRHWLPVRLNVTTRFPMAAWLNPKVRAQARSIRQRYERELRQYRRPHHRDHAAGYYDIVRHIASGERQEFDPRQVTYPCLHRPLVEFMHAVPFSQKLRCGESRSLQRRALRGVLPAEILTRRGKAAFDEAYMRGLRDDGSVWESLLTNSVCEAREYFDANHARFVLHRIKAGLRDGLAPPLSELALEFWLRAHGFGERTPKEGAAIQYRLVQTARQLEH
jgi:asparagine synthase (glutamine-hydrolysing)